MQTDGYAGSHAPESPVVTDTGAVTSDHMPRWFDCAMDSNARKEPALDVSGGYSDARANPSDTSTALTNRKNNSQGSRP